MTSLLKHTAIAMTVALAAITMAAPAHATTVEPPPGWYVTESEGDTTLDADAPPQTNSSSPVPKRKSRALAPQDDLKKTGRDDHQDQASTQQGWVADRYGRCFTCHRRVELRCAGCTTITASVEFDYTL